MVGTTEAGLHQHPEALDGVRVNVPIHVDALDVRDAVVGVTLPVKLVVGHPLIRVDGGRGEQPLPKMRHQIGLRDSRHHLGNDLARGATGATLSHPEDGSLGRERGLVPALVGVLPLVHPSDVGFIHLHAPA